MASTSDIHETDRRTGWTAADLYKLLGPMPLDRVRFTPSPGQATEDDVIGIHDREGRLCELVDRVLVEKTADVYESLLAAEIARSLTNFVMPRKLGFVLGVSGAVRLAAGLVRIPDCLFISWDRLPERKIPRTPMLEVAPDLAVEVISPGNTRQEMDRKLRDYFAASVRAVWYIYPKTKTVAVYGSPTTFSQFDETETIHGGWVLPGYSLTLRDFFQCRPADTVLASNDAASTRQTFGRIGPRGH